MARRGGGDRAAAFPGNGVTGPGGTAPGQAAREAGFGVRWRVEGKRQVFSAVASVEGPAFLGLPGPFMEFTLEHQEPEGLLDAVALQ